MQPPFIPGDRGPASDVGNEYDPAYPNEYEKVVKMLRDRRMKEMESVRERDRGDRDRGER